MLAIIKHLTSSQESRIFLNLIRDLGKVQILIFPIHFTSFCFKYFQCILIRLDHH